MNHPHLFRNLDKVHHRIRCKKNFKGEILVYYFHKHLKNKAIWSKEELQPKSGKTKQNKKLVRWLWPESYLFPMPISHVLPVQNHISLRMACCLIGMWYNKQIILSHQRLTWVYLFKVPNCITDQSTV